MIDKAYARADALVQPQWLEEHLHDPAIRLVEVDVSPARYEAGHIEGAVLWNIYQDLKDANYQLVDSLAIETVVTRSGIGPDSTVVFYGYAPAMGFWLMNLYGHTAVHILDCSRDSWERTGRPWTREVPAPAATEYRLPPQNDELRADQNAVANAIADPSITILDVRTGGEFRGEQFWPSGGMEPGGRAGHIPSARNLPIDALRDDDGAFAGTDDVRRLFASVGPTGDGEVLPYCTIGARACTTWFALTYLLGRQHVRVYDGSWAEWGRMPGVPVDSA